MIDPNSTSDLSDTFDPMFLYLYTVEMGLKILALGFILNEGSYLRDYWNILDFTIISTGYLPLIMGSDSSVNLSSLRSLRVLRPLRTISRIKALKTILVTLFSAMPLILSSVMVNLFFLLIFAIAGLQLFSGLLKKRCFHSFTGVALQQPVDNIDVTIKGVICGYESCPNDYTCGRMIENPNFDLINFDTIFYSFLMIFQCITLEGWTNIMYLVVKSFSIFTTLFFIILVWIGAYFLVNLTLAVISTKFKEAQEKKNENKELIGDDDEDEEEKITGPSVVDIRNLKLCEKSHHKRSLRSLANTNLYGANEEIFKKKELEVRWDDLFELKERIREERERLESEENFIKVRDQELEGSNYKIHHRKKKNDLRYLPKANPHTGKTPLIMQKIFHKSKKLRFVGIQGVNLEKKKHKNRKSVISIKETNNFEQSLDKSKGETFKLINIDEEEAFFQESSKKAENFQETNPDLYNISSILKKPKTFHKAPSNFLEDQKEKSIRSIQKIQNPTMNSFNMMKEEKSEKDPKIMYRQRTFEHKNLNSSSKEKKLDIKIKRSSLQMDTKNFFESKQKLKNFIKKPSFMDSNQTNFNNHRVFQRRISRKISRKITHLSFNSHSDHSNLESTILNDSDFNIGGFEKSEKKKLSLTLIPIENSLLKNDTSPFTRNAGILHPLIAGNRLKNVITQTIEKKNEKSINSSKILKRDSSIEAEVLSQQNLKISPVEDNTRISKNTDLLNFESDIIDKNDNISDNNKQAEENSRLEQPSQAELTYKISDPKLIDEMKAQKPASFLKNGVINNAANHMYKVIAENKIMNKIFPVAAFIQTDPENNNNAYDTDQENGQPKNFSEQASTRTFIETKNTLDQKEKGGSRLLRAFTSFRRRKLKVEKKKEDIERIKRLQIQKKFNVLHYKLMIYVDKIYESNSMDDVLVSYNETLKKAKKEAFEKEIKSVRHMPIYYIPKVLNIKKIDKKRKKQERKLLRDMEKKRHDLIDFQTLTSENILKKILKISTTSPMMPVRFHKNLLAILNKQRSALFGERESRMKASSVTSPLLSRGSKTNISMNFSQRSKNTILINKKKKKNTEIQIKFDYETLKETIKEKLYDKHAVVEQMEEFAYDQIYEEIWLTDFNNHMKNDFYRNIKINLRWSGDDVYDFQDAYNKKFNESSSKDLFSLFKLEKIQKRINRLMNSISSISYQKDVWLLGFKGKLILAQKYLRYCVNSKYFDNSMLFCVIFNTVILAMDGLFYDPDTVELFSNFNQSLTMIFSVEMALKLISDSPKRYLSDKMNIFDGSVVIISQVELWALSGSKGLSAFRTVRIFRTFRVLRVTRLLRSLEFMRTIINVVARCIDSLIYIGFLLLLLNVIYSLIGIQIFSGKLDNDSIGIRQNFDNFNDAFLTVYQLMTVENWNDILTVTLLSDVGASLTCLYLISWIFLGNYVFLNLILAILLEAFSEEWENQKLMNDDDDFEDFDEKEKERIRKEQIEKEQEIRIMAMEADDLERELLAKTRKPHEKPLYEGVSCGNSLFIFPKSNPFRKACYRIVHSNYFENFILFLIILSSFKLAIDTYMSDDDEDVLIFSTYIDNFFNGLFGMECILKLISFGFFMDNGSYLRDNWNILDFIIVCSSIVDMSVASINLPFIKILRLLRTLRPLRFISHNLNMKIVVTALLESAGPIANVSIVVLLIFLMFSIFGMSMLQDRFGYCDYEYSYGVQYNVNIDQVKFFVGGFYLRDLVQRDWRSLEQ